MKTAIVFLGHGTRNPKGLEEFGDLTTRVRAGLAKLGIAPSLGGEDNSSTENGSYLFDACFLELASPDFLTCVARCVEKGARHFLLVPVFLFSAGHLKEDIPHLIREAEGKHPGVSLYLGEPIGETEEFISAAVHRLYEVGFRKPEVDRSLLLVLGRGSHDEEAQRRFISVANSIAGQAGMKYLETGFLAGSGRSFGTTLTACQTYPIERVYVLPYLLFEGYLTTVQIPRDIRRWQEEHAKPGAEEDSSTNSPKTLSSTSGTSSIPNTNALEIIVAGHLGVQECVVESLRRQVQRDLERMRDCVK